MNPLEEVLYKMGVKMYMVFSVLITAMVLSTTKKEADVKPFQHFVQKFMGGVLALIITPGICYHFNIKSTEVISLISVALTITSMPIVLYLNKHGQTILNKITDKFLK